jgi:hypothetical protein
VIYAFPQKPLPHDGPTASKRREDERMSDPKRIKHINFRVTDEEYAEIEKQLEPQRTSRTTGAASWY